MVRRLYKAESSLVDYAADWRGIFDHVQDVMLVYDRDLIVTEANHSATAFFGQTLKQLIGASYQQLFDKPAFKGDGSVLENIRMTKRLEEAEIYIPDTEKWVLSSMSPILDAAGNICRIVHFIRDITQSKHVQKMLSKNNERMELVLQGADLGIWDWNIQTGEVIFNQRWAKMLGYELEDIKPHVSSWEELVHPDDAAKIEQLLKAHFEGRSSVYESEHRLKTKSGDWKWVLDHGKIVEWDADSKPLRMTGTHLDITSQKNLTRRLEENEINFRSFFDSVENLLSVMDIKGDIIEVNKSLTERLCYKREELIGKNILTLHPEECREQAQKTVEEMVGGKSKSCPLPLITKDGQYIPAETYVVKGLWSGREVLFGISKDISAIKESEEKFYTAFHSNAVLMAISTLEDGIFVDVNEQFCKTLGYSRDEVIGKTSGQLDLFINHQERDEIKKKTIETGHMKDVNVAVRKKDGQIRYGLFSADKLILQQGTFLLTVMNDITERKLAEDALKDMNNSLERAVQKRTADLNKANLRMSDEILLRCRAEEMLRYRLSIEVAVAKSSKLFLSSDTVEITELLGILGNAVSANRAYIFEFDPDLDKMDNTYEWCDEFTIAQKENLQNIDTAMLPWWMKKLERHESIIITNVSKLPPEAEIEKEVLSSQSIKSLLVVPMIWSCGKLCGFMGFDDTSKYRLWLQEDIDALTVMAKMTVLYMEQKKAKYESSLHYEQLTALSSRLLQKREEERKNISREIHDELGTVLTVMKFDLSWIGKRISSTCNEVQAKITLMSKTIDATVKMVQKICTELRPSLIDNMGLLAAMEWHIAEFEKRTEIECEVDLPESIMPESKYSIDIFRIFQELLTNVARHAQATRVKVRLRIEDNILNFTITDNGCGIDSKQIWASGSLGLIGIRERVKYLNGEFDITGAAEGGTIAAVRIPFLGKAL